MTASREEIPDDPPRTALVLSGGGARAAYQVGVLNYIGRRVPNLDVPIITGVSAGAINASYLASHTGSWSESTGDLRREWCALNTEDVIRTDPWSLLVILLRWARTLFSGGIRFGPEARSLVDNQPLRERLDGLIDPGRIQENLRQGRLDALAISTTSYQTGRTVTFVQGSRQIPMWSRPDREARRARITSHHAMASAAIPILFPAERVGNGFYGDGSIRQSAPLAPAIHLGADRLIAVSSRYGRTVNEARKPAVHGYPPAAQIAGLLMNSVFLDALEADATRIERLNRLLSKLPEDARSEETLKPVELMVLRPSMDLGRLALRYERQLPHGLRFLSRGLGTRESESPDFLSYLLYEQEYIGRLTTLGARDAERNWPRIARFLDLEPREEGERWTVTQQEEEEEEDEDDGKGAGEAEDRRSAI